MKAVLFFSAFSSIIRFSSAEPGKNACARKTTTSTKYVDGKKVVTKMWVSFLPILVLYNEFSLLFIY